MAYSIDEKAMAIVILQRYGGMTAEALAMIGQELGRCPSKSTLHDWLHRQAGQEGNRTTEPNRTEPPNHAEPRKNRTIKKAGPVPLEALEAADLVLSNKLEQIANQYADFLLSDKGIPKDMKPLDAAKVMGITIDKMRVLRNMPTEIVSILPSILLTIERAGMNPVDFFIQLNERMKQEVNLN